MKSWTMNAGDTRPALNVILKDGNGTVVDVTGLTIVFTMRRRRDRTRKVDRRSVTINDGSAGDVEYRWQTDGADTDEPGEYVGEFEVDFGSSSIETFPNNRANELVITLKRQGG